MQRSLLAVFFISVASPGLAEELLFPPPSLMQISESGGVAEPDVAEPELVYEESPTVYPETEELGSPHVFESHHAQQSVDAGHYHGKRAAHCRHRASYYSNGYAGYGYRYGGHTYYYMPSMPYYHPEYGYDSYRPLHHAPRQRKSRCNHGY